MPAPDESTKLDNIDEAKLKYDILVISAKELQTSERVI
jgi:hypothetical protein